MQNNITHKTHGYTNIHTHKHNDANTHIHQFYHELTTIKYVIEKTMMECMTHIYLILKHTHKCTKVFTCFTLLKSLLIVLVTCFTIFTIFKIFMIHLLLALIIWLLSVEKIMPCH